MIDLLLALKLNCSSPEPVVIDDGGVKTEEINQSKGSKKRRRPRRKKRRGRKKKRRMKSICEMTGHFCPKKEEATTTQNQKEK